MDLLPCPFCGAKPPYVELIKVFVRDDGQPDSWAENKKNRWQVGCGPCAAHSAVCKSEGEAVAHWNVRHEPARYDPLHQYLRGEVDALTRLLREAEALAVVPDTDTEVDRARALVFRWIDHGRDGDPDCAACGGSGSALVDEEPGQRTFKMCPCQDRIAEARDLVGWDGTWGLEDRKP